MTRHARVPGVLRPLAGVALLWLAAAVLTAAIVFGIGAGAIQ